ncbi:MAG: hypothetical protein HN725_05065 [Alphaproteobacteria bacterium]|jgi:hypothetical protein|nr:hypothetical protein [Alphaproteobacteria bacterium]MBT4083731.1 hypothetical protein [Alphaproteobacteria bacterium]MBT4545253.1 hypothetical protein [Alphaproteobacteria bacterium]MBT5917212.1 hypothetical protein [Alphaproteobacteria bacterium]MBT6386215.1 hypothetical protein [Alphaproteobacteria bacterium]
MLEFYSGLSTAVNSKQAASECIELALGDDNQDCDLLVIHSTVGHNFPQALAAARAACPSAQIVGCSGAGVIGRGSVSENMRAMAVMAARGSELAVASADGLSAGTSRTVAAKAAEELKAANNDISIIYCLTTGLDVRGDEVIAGIESVFGPDIPIIGATAADNGKAKKTFQFHNDKVMENGIVLVGFADPSLELVMGIHHGSVPLAGMTMEVTKSDGNQILELDGKPSWPTLMSKVGLPIETPPAECMGISGLGIDLVSPEQKAYDNPQVLRATFEVSDDNQTFSWPTSCPEGSKVVLMQRDEDLIFDGVDRMTTRMNEAYKERKPEAVFHADCMARGRLTFDRVLKDEIMAKIQHPICGDTEVPWLGVYGYSEYAPVAGRNEFHSFTTSVFSLVRKEGA